MYLVIDENGIAIDYNKLITIVSKVKVTGSGGTILYFHPFQQYFFESVVMKTLTCLPCDQGENRLELHYVVAIFEETYAIPSSICAMEYNLRTRCEQDYRYNQEHKNYQPRDFFAAFEEATGVDLSHDYYERHNGYQLWLDRKNAHNQEKGKSYGQTTPGEC